MFICIPTLKYTDFSKGVHFKEVVNSYFSEEEMNKLEFPIEMFDLLNRNRYYGSKVKNVNGTFDYSLPLEKIHEQYSYRGKKLEYLQKHAVKNFGGWVLPISKLIGFLELIQKPGA